MTPGEFRKQAMRISGAVESEHMAHPDFRIDGKVFASLGAPDNEWGMVKVTPAEQKALLDEAPAAFKPCSGAWGRQGCTNVHLASAKVAQLRPALEAAARLVAEKNKTKPRTKLK